MFLQPKPYKLIWCFPKKNMRMYYVYFEHMTHKDSIVSVLLWKLYKIFDLFKNKHERDFVLQVRCWDLNNSCDKISTLRGTKAVTNIILGFFGGNIWELSLIVYIFGNSYEILWILWELSVIVYILKFSWLFAFPNQLIVII